MRKEDFAEVLGDINENYVKEAETIKKTRKPAWLKWGAMAACLCLVIFGVTMWNKVQTQPDNSASTLLGADEIYPTIMVEGNLYEWRKGAAICSELPDDCVYYGELIHVEGETPNNNNEFVSVFSVSGQIYTVPQTDTVVYLCLTTDWLENTVVAFDFVEDTITTSGVADTRPMVYVNDTLYKQSTEQISYGEIKEEFIYLGKIESDVTNDQSITDGVPKENFQANHPIVGAEVYQYNENIVIQIDGDYWLYEAFST